MGFQEISDTAIQEPTFLFDVVTWLAIATVIAAGALIYKIYDGRQARKHSQISVKPEIRVHADFTQPSLSFVLQNGGVGPAIVTKIQAYEITIEGRKDIESLETWANAKNGILSSHVRWGKSSSMVLPAGEDWLLLKIDFFINASMKEIEAVMDSTKWVIEYQDIYGTKFEFGDDQ